MVKIALWIFIALFSWLGVRGILSALFLGSVTLAVSAASYLVGAFVAVWLGEWWPLAASVVLAHVCQEYFPDRALLELNANPARLERIKQFARGRSLSPNPRAQVQANVVRRSDAFGELGWRMQRLRRLPALGILLAFLVELVKQSLLHRQRGNILAEFLSWPEVRKWNAFGSTLNAALPAMFVCPPLLLVLSVFSTYALRVFRFGWKFLSLRAAPALFHVVWFSRNAFIIGQIAAGILAAAAGLASASLGHQPFAIGAALWSAYFFADAFLPPVVLFLGRSGEQEYALFTNLWRRLGSLRIVCLLHEPLGQHIAEDLPPVEVETLLQGSTSDDFRVRGNFDWQPVVQSLIATVPLVVVDCRRSPSDPVRQEIAWIVEQGYLYKTIFVVEEAGLPEELAGIAAAAEVVTEEDPGPAILRRITAQQKRFRSNRLSGA